MLHKLCSFAFNFLPIKKNRVCLINFDGQGFGCNPKYIANELLKHPEFELYWLYKSRRRIDFSEFPKKIKLVKKRSIRGLYYLATTNVLVSNARTNFYSQEGLKKKDNQIYIQTWHGALGIKPIGNAHRHPDPEYAAIAKIDSKNTDYILAGTRWVEETAFNQESFFYNGPICRFGTPRNDIFFQDNRRILEKVQKYFHLASNDKFLLYVPTFRRNKGQNAYNIDYKRLKENMEDKFGGNWKIISRLHPVLWKKQNLLPDLDYVLDGSHYPDIQELLATADAAISDYSSCIFDYLLSKKPAFLYATDISEYESYRGFYYDIRTVPFPIAENNDELERRIQNFDIKDFQQKAADFLKSKGSYETGHAAQKCVNLIMNEIEKRSLK